MRFSEHGFRVSALVAVVVSLALVVAGCGSGKKRGSISVTVVTTTPSVKTASVSGPVSTQADATVTNTFGPVGRPAQFIRVIGPTATFPNVETGALVTCTGGPSVRVPRRGVSVGAGQIVATPGGTPPAPPKQIQVKHLLNGWITVSCKTSH